MLAKLRVRSPVVLALLASTVLVSGCSLLNRHKNTVDTTYAESPVDQLYAAGAARLDHKAWSEGISYFKEVERQHPYSEWSRRSIMMEAYAHYEANQYQEAIADASRFIELYPGNASTSYAYYLKAECYFEQILDVGRDQAATEQALAAMREVTRRYPKTEYAQDARLKIDMINDQLAGKEMTIGRWYLRQQQTLAAIGRFRVVVDRYQTTSDTPEALERLVEAYLTLGLVEEAKRNAAVLGYNFPGDIWYADAYKLMTDKGLKPDVAPKPNSGFFRRVHFPSLKSKHGSAIKPPADIMMPGTRFDQNYNGSLSRPEDHPNAPAASPASDQGQADQGAAADQTQEPAKKRGWFHVPSFGKKPAASSAPASAAPAPAPSPASSDQAQGDQTNSDQSATDASQPAAKKKGWFHLPSFGKKPADSSASSSAAPAAN